ncbi:MAG TPA: FGGY family carbohydrate kinase, partial [Gemmatimonadales bacterium]|nr:FGGY family carbohydrate kinase [Gemmatimonadales bacterium]
MRADAGALFAGLDVSTQGCKLVVVSTSGAPVHVDRVDYDRDLPQFGTVEGTVSGLCEGCSESDPRMWIEAARMLLGRLRQAGVPASAIRCISVSGQQHGLVALTADGTLARPRAKLWNDFSTAVECRILTDAVGGPAAMLREVGNTQRTGYTAPKILHLKRHEPERYAASATLFVVHNYVNWWLTGGPEGGIRALEPGDTSGMALWHPGTERWSSRVMSAIDPALMQKLPPLLPADRTIGTVGRELRERFGFAEGCRVDAGSGDNMYSAVGTGNVEPGIVTISLGTSGTACTVLDEPFVDPTGEIAAYRDSAGRHLPLLCVSNMAGNYDRLLERFGLSHGDFEALIAATRPGNEGRVLVPWFVGERTPDVPNAKPVAFGFDLESAEPAVLCRALLEGSVMNLHEGFVRMPVNAREIRLTGGLSASRAWC